MMSFILLLILLQLFAATGFIFCLIIKKLCNLIAILSFWPLILSIPLNFLLGLILFGFGVLRHLSSSSIDRTCHLETLGI